MSSFFSELKRRNVFRVGVAYAIVAWLIAQIIDVVNEPLNLPDWFDTVVIVLLGIGFLLAVFLAWVYELTPEGIKVTTPEGPAQYHTRTTGQRLNIFILGVVVLAVAFMLVDNYVLVDEVGITAASVTGPVSSTTDDSAAIPGYKASSSQSPPSTPSQVRRSLINLGKNQVKSGSLLDAFIALSRDGRHLVYSAQQEGTQQLYHRPLDQLAARPMAGTEGAGHVYLSPNGEWALYETGFNGGLYKIAVVGGPPQPLDQGGVFIKGAFWGEDDVIYYTKGINGSLYRIAASGGEPEPVTVRSEDADWSYGWPNGLPGGTHLLLTAHQNPIGARDGHTLLLSLATGETRTLIRNGFHAKYVPTGHIVFMRSGSLWAVPFDAKQLKTTGPEVPVVNGVQTSGGFGQAVYAFSAAGFLIYLPGDDVQAGDAGGVTTELVWVDRQGNETPVGTKPDRYLTPRLSPDETQVALTVGQLAVLTDIWTYDLKRGTLSRRTFDGNSVRPLWSPDGSHLVYTFIPNWKGLAWVRADGTGRPEPLLDAPRLLMPGSFTPDGSQLIYSEAVITGPEDIYSLSLTGERTERPLLATVYSESNPSVSPDGRWLAYQSEETGQQEIYVRPFPNVNDGKWQVSTNGGWEPCWRGDGGELFYRQGVGPITMMSVTVDTGQGFQAGTPRELFSGDYYGGNIGDFYDAAADGQRFLMLKTSAETGEAAEPSSRQVNLVLVENWFDELKRLAPPAQ